MDRCPTCGREVPNVFEHVDAECQNWPDRSEAVPHKYRGYDIETHFAMGYQYVHEDYDGPEDSRCGTEKSVELCYRSIDEREDD